VVMCFIGARGVDWKLIFDDEFNFFNLSFLEHEITLGGGGNWEFQVYTNNRTTSFVKNGLLHLNPVLTSSWIGDSAVTNGGTISLWGGAPGDQCTSNAFYGCERFSNGYNYLNPVMSARIRSARFLWFRYGKVEVRAKLPKGDWLWPAIWMLPRFNYYGTWPASGEIDILEGRGNGINYPDGGYNTASSALHWAPFFPSRYQLTMGQVSLPADVNAPTWHNFTLEWEDTFIKTYVDDRVILHVDMASQSFWQRGGWGPEFNNPWAGRGNNAPFDQEFFLVMNLAVGGTTGYFADGVPGKPWSNQSPTASAEFWNNQGSWLPTWDLSNPALPSSFQIDYVRVYCNNLKGGCPAKVLNVS